MTFPDEQFLALFDAAFYGAENAGTISSFHLALADYKQRTGIDVADVVAKIAAGTHVVVKSLTPPGEIVRRHADWTDEGMKLPQAEKEAILDAVLKRNLAQREDAVLVPRQQLKDIYAALCKLTKLGQTNIHELDTTPEAVLALRLEVFRAAEFPSMFAGNWLNHEDKEEVRAMIRAASTDKSEG